MALLNEKPDVEAELSFLPSFNLTKLRAKWKDQLGSNAPASLSPNLLRGAIAYHLQEVAFGGLCKQAKLRLKALMASPRDGSMAATYSKFTRPGTKFLREWQNTVHEVQVVTDGKYIYQGHSYNSLTVIAHKITGTHQSGPKFFGLKRKNAKPITANFHHG